MTSSRPARSARAALAALLALALVACCPAPLAADAAAPADGATLVGVVESSDGTRTWLASEGAGRVAVRPPLEQPPGTVVYLRGRWRDGGFVRSEAAALGDAR